MCIRDSDKIAIVTDDAATSIPTPKVGSYTLENITFDTVSYTHLDVYKRQRSK